MGKHYDIACIGGGLSNLLFLHYAKPSLTHKTIAIIDAEQPEKRELHWSYWTKEARYFDEFSLASWRHIKIASQSNQKINPYTLRVVRSDHVIASLLKSIESLHITWVREPAYDVKTGKDETAIEISTATQSITARLVFDSAPEVEPRFEPQGYVSGLGYVVESKQALFDEKTAEFFAPLGDGGIAYTLPFSQHKALIESVYFTETIKRVDGSALKTYIQNRYGRKNSVVTHTEQGAIPLGIASQSIADNHILMGTKRGLVKATAGYGVARIDEEARMLAELFARGLTLPSTRRYSRQSLYMDKYFLSSLKNDSFVKSLMHETMSHNPPTTWFRLIDEDFSVFEYAIFMIKSLPFIVKNR